MSNQSIFSKSKKDALSVGREITNNGLSWRKLSDGSGVWRFDIKMNGTRKKGVLGRERDGVTLSQAKVLLADIRAKYRLEGIETKNNPNRLGFQLFEDAAKVYLNWSKVHNLGHKSNISRMNYHLIPRFGKYSLENITVSDVEDMKTDLIVTNKLAEKTVMKVIFLMSSVYRHAIKKDRALLNPTKGVSKFRITPSKIKVFESRDIDSLLLKGVMNSRDSTLVGLACFAGLRASEVLGLDWKDIDFDADRIKICRSALEGVLRNTTKSGKSRYVCITKRLKNILYKRLSDTGGVGLVVSPNGDVPYYGVQKMFKKIKMNADVNNDGGLHGLRHTFATRAIEKGVTLPVVQLWLGHRSIEMTMKYIHVSDAHINDMAALLN